MAAGRALSGLDESRRPHNQDAAGLSGCGHFVERAIRHIGEHLACTAHAVWAGLHETVLAYLGYLQVDNTIVTYDGRMMEGARSLGLPVVAPR